MTFATVESAREASQRLNGNTLDGGNIKVERLMDRRTRPTRGGGGIGTPRGMAGLGSNQMSHRPTEFPLRILVLSEMVGAIIGRQGATIRTITQQVRLFICIYKLSLKFIFVHFLLYSIITVFL